MTDSRDAPLIERVIETDRAYFELGAQTRQIPGATLAWIPGLSGAAAGAVVHRVDVDRAVAGGQQWLAEAEWALADVGAKLARIYLDGRATASDAMLRRAGYTDRDEIAFVRDFPEPSSLLSLSPVGSDADWERKIALHELCDGSPDGHCTAARDWVALERAKCAHGMEMFIAESDGQVVGTAGLIAGQGVARLKNLVVHPGRRRRRFGESILAHVAAIGRARGLPTLGLFAVAGEPGELLYRAVGMRNAGIQVEWSKPLGQQTA
jgi:GNAT superfamily N-acetyltransferase